MSNIAQKLLALPLALAAWRNPSREQEEFMNSKPEVSVEPILKEEEISNTVRGRDRQRSRSGLSDFGEEGWLLRLAVQLLGPAPGRSREAAESRDGGESNCARLWPRQPHRLPGADLPDGTLLPEQFRKGAFVGQHGSWNCKPRSGYKVIFVPFANGKPLDKPKDVLTGFLRDDDALGRPVGVTIDRKGALLVADDVGNTIWRVTPSPNTAIKQ